LKETVSAEWLYKNLSNPNLIILDASIKTNASEKMFKNFDLTIPKITLKTLCNNTQP